MSKGIYVYIDTKTNEVIYVGKDSHINILKRHKIHTLPSQYNNQPVNKVIQSNPKRFKYKVIKEFKDCSDDELNKWECYYIKFYNTYHYNTKKDLALNFTTGGEGETGRIVSDETRKKIGKANSGWKMSTEERNRLKEYYKTHHHANYGTSILEEYGGLDFIKQSILDGKTATQLSQEVGLSSHKSIAAYLEKRGTSWTQLCEELNVEMNRGWYKKSEIDKLGGIDYLKQQIIDGKSALDIAKGFGWKNANGVYNYLMKRGLHWTNLKQEVENDYYSKPIQNS